MDPHEPETRAAGASALQKTCAKDPRSVGDHGEAYWVDRIARVRGRSASEAMTVLEPPRGMGGEAGGGGATETYQLDDFWMTTLARSTRARLYLGTSDHGAITVLVPPCPGLERFILRGGEYPGYVPLLVGATLRMGFREMPLPLFPAVPLSLNPLLESEYVEAIRAGNAGGLITAGLFERRGWGFWNRLDRPSVYDGAG